MNTKLKIKKKATQSTQRVKSVDVHDKYPLLLVGLFTGKIIIYNFMSKKIEQTIEATNCPIRSVKWIDRKEWFVACSDDGKIMVFNYNTLEKVKQFEAHPDYIRNLAVHPTLPYLLSCSDDFKIKLWDWSEDWVCKQTFEGHSHYVMSVEWNPRDPTTFASGSLDRTVKFWGIESPVARFTLDAHHRGVNTVAFSLWEDRPFIVSGSDDQTICIWDFQMKTCIHVIEGHFASITSVICHPSLPLIISGSEDGSVRIWNSQNFRPESSLSYSMDRCWTLSTKKQNSKIAIGFDFGFSVVKMGKEVPSISLENSGKIVWAKQTEIKMSNVKSGQSEQMTFADGEKLSLAVKELGNCEVVPEKLKHSPNGRFVSVVGNGEFTIYTALAWRNKAFGSGTQFVWCQETNNYAVLENKAIITMYNNFQEQRKFSPFSNIKKIFGGTLLAVKSIDDFICFYDWDMCRFIQRIEVVPKEIYWSDTGDMLAITTNDSFFILNYDKQVVNAVLETQEVEQEDGIEAAFTLVSQITQKVVSGTWIGDCFLFNTSDRKLSYCIQDQITTIAHFDLDLYLLGYLPRLERAFLADKDSNIYSYSVSLAEIDYQTAILHNDFDIADKILPRASPQSCIRIARFLDSLGMYEKALGITTDFEHKFELALKLKDIQKAVEIAEKVPTVLKWKQLIELSLPESNFEVAEKCMWKINDLSGLMLYYSSISDKRGIKKVAEVAQRKGQENIAFTCLFMMGEIEKCIDLLCKCQRIPEAAFMARSYLPSKVPQIVQLWKQYLKKNNSEKVSETIASPEDYLNLFPNYENSLKVEEYLTKKNQINFPSFQFEKFKNDPNVDLIQKFQNYQEQDINELDKELNTLKEKFSSFQINLDSTPNENMNDEQNLIDFDSNIKKDDQDLIQIIRIDEEIKKDSDLLIELDNENSAKKPLNKEKSYLD
ncbi:coatomer subunit beta'-1 [Anaeramoeba ignava]|uniref:Coatomer subunit beta' n=1 Tax=Anaeramoeba ignava TaxID=1746090 RepID=A0A9Q0LHK6_ANAIG|nr:coatomer subunit beta'-1 [Anaeramoeba ignava]|eukprot:Anaeramoba_ignava/a89982_50.p1 GENE.a89982_50~~a89982_50.p1  ORF type:complete len:939 (+),score=205.88 a89982_50:40-2856(+)